MTAAVKVPHVHAEVIKAWADGAQVQFQFYATKEWGDDIAPQFHVERQYRVKPEPPAKVYPVTQMSHDEIWDAIRAEVPCQFSIGVTNLGAPYSPQDVERAIANAALRHACDANQIISMADHLEALLTLGRNLRDVEITRHADRDMAIAKAVRDVCHAIAKGNGSTVTAPDIREMNLATIIAKVRP